MKVGVFFKDGTNAKFENVVGNELFEDFLVLWREPSVHKEVAKIPRENIEYYVLNNDISENDKEKEK